MALKDNWVDKVDGQDIVQAEDINSIARAVIDLEDGGDEGDGNGGYTFFPSVDEEGNLSWTNNGGLENPETVNIKGEKGEDGTATDEQVETYINAWFEANPDALPDAELREQVDILNDEIFHFEEITVSWAQGGASVNIGQPISFDSVNTRAHNVNPCFLTRGSIINSENFYINRFKVDENGILLSYDNGWTDKTREIEEDGYYYFVLANTPTTASFNISAIDVRVSRSVSINEKINALKNEVGVLQEIQTNTYGDYEMEQGGFDADGTKNDSLYRVRSVDYLPNDVLEISCENNEYTATIALFDSDGNYKNLKSDYSIAESDTPASSFLWDTSFDIQYLRDRYPNYGLKLLAGRVNYTVVTPEEIMSVFAFKSQPNISTVKRVAKIYAKKFAPDANMVNLLNDICISDYESNVMSHASNTVYHNGYFYSIYEANDDNGAEDGQNTSIYVKMSKFSICNPRDVKHFDIARIDTPATGVETQTVPPYEPNLLVVGGYLYCYYSVNNQEYHLKKFNLETEELDSNTTPLMLNSALMNRTNVLAEYNRLSPNPCSNYFWMVMTSAIKYHNGYFYAVVTGRTNFNGIVIRSTDGINWESVSVPTTNLGEVWETNIEFEENTMHTISRVTGSGVFYATFDISTQEWTEFIKLSSVEARPYLKKCNGVVYCMYNVEPNITVENPIDDSARSTATLFSVVNGEFDEVATFMNPMGMHYFALVEVNSQLYCTYSTNNRRIHNGRDSIMFHKIGFIK